MLTQIVTTKLEIAKVAACDQTGLATRAKLVHFSLDSDACFIDAILRFLVSHPWVCKRWMTIYYDIL